MDQLKAFESFLDTLIEEYSRQADRDCREAVREADNREKIIAARESLARHEAAAEIRWLVDMRHRAVQRQKEMAKELRAEPLSFTEAETAARVGVSRETIAAWEDEGTGPPNPQSPIR